MNAKITLTVPMENIPKEVERILKSISVNLDGLRSETFRAAEMDDLVGLMNQIDDLRKSLTLLDANYEDCYSILVGYMRYQAETRMRDTKKEQTMEQTNDKQSNG